MYAVNFRDAVVGPRGLPQLRKFARDTVLWARSLTAMPSGPPALRLLYCHYVFDDQRDAFAVLIDYLQSIGSFIRTSEVLDVVEGRRPVLENQFHLSFDDGFRNVVANAFPILAQRGISAAFFVPTSIVSSDERTAEDYCRNTLRYPRPIEIVSWDDLA